MIVFIDGKEMVMCERCWRRWPKADFLGVSMRHLDLCQDCSEPRVNLHQGSSGPRVVSAGAWCGTPALSRTWAQGQEGV